MSGGHFDYQQYRIQDIADTIEQLIQNNGREKTQEEMMDEHWNDPEWYEKYPQDRFHLKYDDAVIARFKMGVEKLKEAYIYAHRIDWYLSGDDGATEFLQRLQEDLKKQD